MARRKHHHGYQGITFGVMEAAIMMIGVMLGLSVTKDKFVIILGVLVAGVADSLANAAAFHVSEETEIFHKRKEVLKSTFFCFLGTLVTVVVLLLPMVFLQLEKAIIAAIIIGVLIMILLGVFVSRMNKKFVGYKLAFEYLVIGALTVIICYLLGILVNYIKHMF